MNCGLYVGFGNSNEKQELGLSLCVGIKEEIA